MSQGQALQEALQEHRRLKETDTELRRCLRCDSWMHSAGAHHRICNLCTNPMHPARSRVGSRVA